VDELKEHVDVPEAPRVMIVGLHVAVRPDGLTAVVRVTVPVKPFTLVTVIVVVPVEPAAKLTLVGLAVIVKSPALTAVA